MAGIEDMNSMAADDGNEDVESEITNDKAVGDKQNVESGGFTEAQRKLLDKIVRDGIMVGYHHAKGHIRLVDFFCQTMRRLVDAMGILSVKYLKVCPLSIRLCLLEQSLVHSKKKPNNAIQVPSSYIVFLGSSGPCKHTQLRVIII